MYICEGHFCQKKEREGNSKKECANNKGHSINIIGKVFGLKQNSVLVRLAIAFCIFHVISYTFFFLLEECTFLLASGITIMKD